MRGETKPRARELDQVEPTILGAPALLAVLSACGRMVRRFPWKSKSDAGVFLGGNRVQLLAQPGVAFDAMIAAIDAAAQQILLEMYWFASDSVGLRFSERLCAAAERGVKVAVLYDGLGSWETEEVVFDRLRAQGVEVVEHSPIAPWRRRFAWRRLSLRDHRKLLVVDGRIGFTGGVNLSKQSLPESEGGDAWRDDVVQLEGSVVSALTECFWQAFRREGGRQARQPAPAPRTPLADDVLVRLLVQDGPRRRYQILSAYLERIRNAERRIWLKNAYFIPDRAVFKALSEAARRGVDVRVVVPFKSDVPVAKYAGQRKFAGLMAGGVRIFEWLPTVLHSKTAVIDSEWSTIGTFNLDHLSFRTNLEVNVAVLDAVFAQTMEASFLKDLESCRELSPHTFEQRSALERMAEFSLYQLRRFL